MKGRLTKMPDFPVLRGVCAAALQIPYLFLDHVLPVN